MKWLAVASAVLLLTCNSDASAAPPTAAATTTAAATATPQPTPTQAARPAATETPVPTIIIAAVGDLMIARDVTTLMQQHGAAYPFERVLPLFEGADLLIGNLEGTFTDRGDPLDKFYPFRTPPEFAEALTLAGFDAVSLANNHSYDFGLTGLEGTLATLAATPVIVALLSFNDIGETASQRPTALAWRAPPSPTR